MSPRRFPLQVFAWEAAAEPYRPVLFRVVPHPEGLSEADCWTGPWVSSYLNPVTCILIATMVLPGWCCSFWFGAYPFTGSSQHKKNRIAAKEVVRFFYFFLFPLKLNNISLSFIKPYFFRAISSINFWSCSSLLISDSNSAFLASIALFSLIRDSTWCCTCR